MASDGRCALIRCSSRPRWCGCRRRGRGPAARRRKEDKNATAAGARELREDREWPGERDAPVAQRCDNRSRCYGARKGDRPPSRNWRRILQERVDAPLRACRTQCRRSAPRSARAFVRRSLPAHSGASKYAASTRLRGVSSLARMDLRRGPPCRARISNQELAGRTTSVDRCLRILRQRVDVGV